jgi:hypothetical protein
MGGDGEHDDDVGDGLHEHAQYEESRLKSSRTSQ